MHLTGPGEALRAGGRTLEQVSMLHGPDVGEAARAAEVGYWGKFLLQKNWIPNSLTTEHVEVEQHFCPAVSLQHPLLREGNILSATEEKSLRVPDPFSQRRHIG